MSVASKVLKTIPQVLVLDISQCTHEVRKRISSGIGMIVKLMGTIIVVVKVSLVDPVLFSSSLLQCISLMYSFQENGCC